MTKGNRKFIEDRIRLEELKQTLNNIDETLKTIEKSKQPAWKTIREFRENSKCML